MKLKIKHKLIVLLSLLASLSFNLIAGSELADTEVTAKQVAGPVYMLEGRGGNIGLLVTDDGMALVDDKFAPLAQKIEATMRAIKDVPIKYVINTHYHGDHTGSNHHFAQYAPIFAHENVRKRVATNNKKSGADLPVVTFEQGVNIYLGGEEIQLIHFPSGHTDGDSIVYFKHSNVLHMGDLFFQGRFPYVDLKGGGSVKGYLADIKKIKNMFPSDLKIIPGHGELSDMAGLADFIAMIEFSVARVTKALLEGKTEQQIIDAGIGEKYKHWGWQFINEERWLKTLVADLKQVK